jgi:predicted TIM-barrel fold metal-dependent hydrolase
MQTAAENWSFGAIIDADSHMDPPHTMWRDYLPAHLRDQAPTIEAGEEHDWIVFEGSRRPVRMISNQAGRAGKDFKMFGRISEMRSVWEPATRLTDMDTDHIDAAVLFGGGPLGTREPELYIASYGAYNRWVWDYCSADRKRLAPVAYLPMRDVAETVAMLHEVARLGFRSVNIPAFPQAKDGLSTVARAAAIREGQGAALTGDPGGGLTYADAEFDPLWAAFEELDITATMHLGGRIPRFGDKKHLLPDMLMSKLAMAEPVAIMIFGAVFQRFPALRLAIVESGVGWLPFMAEYMDRTWEKQRFWVESPLTDTPSFYMERNIFASFINDREGVLNRKQTGGRNIMWSSDYPHSETSFPNSRKVIARDFAGIPVADVQEIICHRARRLYGVGA